MLSWLGHHWRLSSHGSIVGCIGYHWSWLDIIIQRSGIKRSRMKTVFVPVKCPVAHHGIPCDGWVKAAFIVEWGVIKASMEVSFKCHETCWSSYPRKELWLCNMIKENWQVWWWLQWYQAKLYSQVWMGKMQHGGGFIELFARCGSCNGVDNQ